MKKEVTFTLPASNKMNTKGMDLQGSALVDFPDTLQEAIERYGEEAILSNAWAAWRVVLQAAGRRLLAAGKSPEEIQAFFDSVKMGAASERVKTDPITATVMRFKSMTEEEQAEFLEKLKQMAAR